MTMSYAQAATKWRAGLPLAVGYGGLALLFLVLGVWGAATTIAGAIVSPGTIEVARHSQVVQHPAGGVVGEILAHDGDRVAAGDVLVRLDDRIPRRELAVVESQLVEVMARAARLEAERDGAPEIVLPERLTDLRDRVEGAQDQIAGQERLFHASAESIAAEEAQITQQMEQAGHQIDGTRAQLDATRQQLAIAQDELARAEALLAKGLIEASRTHGLRSDVAALAGQAGQLEARIAEIAGAVAALGIQKVKLGNQRREEAASQLGDLAEREMELGERRFALLDTLDLLEIRSPADGIVHGSKVHALQSVILPAEPILFVVPQETDLVVTARVEATNVDQVRPGQEARLKLTAFDMKVTPELQARVVKVSADAFTDEATGRSYYRATVVPDPGEMALLEGRALLPGMPVQVYIRTADRTPLAYFVKPLTDYFGKALRE